MATRPVISLAGMSAGKTYDLFSLHQFKPRSQAFRRALRQAKHDGAARAHEEAQRTVNPWRWELREWGATAAAAD